MNNLSTSCSITSTAFSDLNRESCRRKLLELEEDLSSFLSLKSTTCLRVSIATYVANKLNSDPVWLLLIAPSSSGKTEILTMLVDLDDVFEVSTLTEGALLSGTPKKETDKNSSGGLLRKIGDYGFIIFKDFTSIIQMNKDKQSPVTAALREIYDGRWTRWHGSDGGKDTPWIGKVGLIAAVTPAIDAHHAVTNTMGERFIMYRIHIDSDTRMLQAKRALEMAGNSEKIRNNLRRKTTELIKSIKIPVQLPLLDKLQLEKFAVLSNQVALCRSSVIRGYDRQIELIPEPESPPRLAKQLLTLFLALQLIGCTNQEAWEAIRYVGFSSMPELRWMILQALYEDSTHDVVSLKSKIRQSETSVRRKLDEMKSFGIIESYKDGKKEIWRLTETVTNDFDVLFMPYENNSGSQTRCDKFSEMSVDPDLNNTYTQLTFRKSNILDSGKELIKNEIEETESA